MSLNKVKELLLLHDLSTKTSEAYLLLCEFYIDKNTDKALQLPTYVRCMAVHSHPKVWPIEFKNLSSRVIYALKHESFVCQQIPQKHPDLPENENLEARFDPKLLYTCMLCTSMFLFNLFYPVRKIVDSDKHGYMYTSNNKACVSEE